MTIRITIIEDDESMLHRLMDIIGRSNSCHIVGMARNRGEAVHAILTDRADVYLVDLGLPDVDGVELIRLISEKCPDARSMVISTFGDSRHVSASLQAGAVGYLLKEEIRAGLVDKVISIRNGHSELSPQVARLVVDRLYHLEAGITPMVDREKVLRSLEMSEREWDVLSLLIEGLPIADIGLRLSISPHTVNQHLRSIYRKFDVRSRAQAVNAARLHGLIA